MRFVGLLIIILSFPAFLAWLRSRPQQRPMALTLIGFFAFLSGSLSADAAIITWPYWPGYVSGVIISLADTLALALLVTRRRRSGIPPFLALFALYALPIAASLAVSGVPMATVFVLFQIARIVLLYIAVAGEIDRPQALRSLVLGLALGLTLQAGFVASQKLQGMVQAMGTMPHQNILGMMTEVALLVVVASVLEGDRRKLVYLGVLGGFVVIAGGGSRGAMALMLLGLALVTVLSFFRRRTTRKVKIMGLGVLCLAVAVPAGLATLSDRFGEGSMLTDEGEREAFEKAARAMARDHPFGVGGNMYVTTANVGGYSARAGVGWRRESRGQPVHNAYLLARAEYGWAGQLAFLILLVVPVVAGLRLAFADRADPRIGVALGGTVAIFIVAVHSNLEWVIVSYECQALLALCMATVGAMIAAAKAERRGRRRASAPDRQILSPSFSRSR